jgi:hypothetical protein
MKKPGVPRLEYDDVSEVHVRGGKLHAIATRKGKPVARLVRKIGLTRKIAVKILSILPRASE